MPLTTRKRRAQQQKHYQDNREKITNTQKAAYKANPEIKKANSKIAYKNNPENKKARSKLAYKNDPEIKKANSKIAYKNDPKITKARSKLAYKNDPEITKARSKLAYKNDPEIKKANSKIAYKNNPEIKKAKSKLAYKINVAKKKIASRRQYARNKNNICSNRKTRYALAKSTIDQSFKKIEGSMQDDANASSILVKKLKKLFPDHSQHISKKNLNKIVTGMATRSILNKVSYIRKESVGGVLKSLRKIRGSDKQDFGRTCHTKSSEPYFYDSAYSVTKHPVIPIDENGKCVIAETFKMKNNKLGWKCTSECKPLSQFEIDAIVALKQSLGGKIDIVRKALNNIDQGCPNGHYLKRRHDQKSSLTKKLLTRYC